MPPPQPLGRSLVPLAGESLPGFLLRLSFRLNLAPAELAGVTSLTAAKNAGSLHAAALTAVPRGGPPGLRAHDPADRQPGQRTRPGRLAGTLPAARLDTRDKTPPPMEMWSLFAPATRYCPECLAGDGSPVQESFGGPWLKDWHLPVIFACPAHRRLLEHRCPECGQDVHAGRASNTLLPACGWPGCTPSSAGRLRPPRQWQAGPFPHAAGPGSTSPDPASTPAPGCSRSRARSSASLTRTVPLAPPAPAARTAGQLLRRPAGTQPARLLDLAGSPGPEPVRGDRGSHRPAHRVAPAAGRRTAVGLTAVKLTTSALRHSTPPSAPAWRTSQTASSLAAPTKPAAQLRLLLPSTTRSAGRTSWARWVTLSAVPCSDGLQAAYDPLLRTSTAPFGRREAAASNVTAAARWGPENVPALIPENWYQRHFTPIDGISPVLARRTAALRLVQMTAGGALAEAAHYLGISTGDGSRPTAGRTYSSAGTVHSGARQQTDPSGFEAGLRSLARELSAPGTPLVNYQRRRQALENWAIDEPTWAGPVPAAAAALTRTLRLGDRRRQIASVYVWVRVTFGEPGFAPRPIEAAQPPAAQEHRRRSWNHTWWSLVTSDSPRSVYSVLRAELDKLAATLAAGIDPPHHGDAPLGTVPLYASRHPRRPRRQRTLDISAEDEHSE